MVCAVFNWFMGSLAGLLLVWLLADLWVIWVVCGWFGWFVDGLDGFWVISSLISNAHVPSNYNL